MEAGLFELNNSILLPSLIGMSLFVIALVVLILYKSRINQQLIETLKENEDILNVLKESEERHRLLADNATDVIWVMDLTGKFTYMSPSVAKMRGYSAAEVLEQEIEQTCMPESAAIARKGLIEIVTAIQQGDEPPEFCEELEQIHLDGHGVWTEVRASGIRNKNGEYIGILGVGRDISVRRNAEQQAIYLAHHDPLTGLANRALFSDRFEQALNLAKREQRLLALMFLDLDDFKPINDTYGHAVGDILLKEAAQRMEQSVRKSDTVARLGGDEFVILLPGYNGIDDALLVANKLIVSLSEPFLIDGKNMTISASIGVATYPEHGDDAFMLFRHADRAMYKAKELGKNCVQLFE